MRLFTQHSVHNKEIREQMMKLLKQTTLIAIFSLLSAGQVQAETILKVASVAPSSSPWGKWMQAAADKIDQTSNGELKLNIILDGQAGDEQTIVRQTIKGRMDIALVSNVPLSLVAPEMAIPSAAYLFDSVEQGSCVAHQHLADTLGHLMMDSGLYPLTWMEVGHYSLFAKEAITEPADLNGKKVRIAITPADSAFAETLGFSGVPLGAESIPALQTGNVDAAAFPTVYGIAIGAHKIAPYITVTNHSRLIGSIAISKRSWDKLSAPHQTILEDTFKAMGPDLTKTILGAEQALLAQLEAAGLPVQRLSAEQMQVWRAASAGTLENLLLRTGGKSADISKAIAAAKLTCGS